VDLSHCLASALPRLYAESHVICSGRSECSLTCLSCLLRSKFKCAALKLAMIKNQHLAETLFGGNVYDCVCLYEPPSV
jgi:hypothetical protein